MMAVVDRAARLLVRAVMTVLMMLAAATPSLAELGCLEEGNSRPALTSAATAPSIVSAGHNDADGKTNLAGGVVHCAFSHCVHGVAAVPPEQNGSGDYSAAAYALPVLQRLLDATVDGPEHPPRA